MDEKKSPKTVSNRKQEISELNLPFDADFLREQIVESSKHYLALSKVLEINFEWQKPFIENIVRDLNNTSRIYSSFFENGSLIKQARIIQEKLNDTLKNVAQTCVALAPPQITYIPSHSGYREIYIAPTPAPNHAEIITEEAIEKISLRVFERIEEKKLISEYQEKPRAKNRLTFPEEKKWDALTLAFINEFDIDIYSGKKFIKKVSHEAIGFIRKNTKDKKYDRTWEFLSKLSTFQGKEDICAPTTEEMSRALNVSDGALHKIKSNLCIGLKEVFPNAENEPFFEYSEYEYYKPCFTLKPIPLLRGDGEVHQNSSGYNEEPPEDPVDY